MGRIVIFPEQRVVTRDGELLKVGSTLFNLLVYFAENRGVVLTKPEIIRGSWLKISISDGTLSNYVGQTRELIGQEGVVTVFNQGYKVVVPVEVLSGRDAEPPVSSLLPRIVKLPRSPYPLVGRELEVAELEDLVRDYRQISLIGPGGVGKTRLAIEIGHKLAKKFLDGVVMIDLAPLTDAAAVASALAQAFDLPLQATGVPIESIADAIGERHMLLILDNCEHLGRVVVDIVKILKEHAPGLTILATSQHVLDGLHHEIYWLKSLAVPPEGTMEPAKIAEYGAAKLFLQRARSGDQRFVFNESNAAGVAEICRRLDGVPLSLEIAATFVHPLAIEGLRRHLDERFGLLRLGEGAAVKRQISLLDMTEWSYGLLDAAEQEFFCRLGIFPGWFSAAEARDIAGDRQPETLKRLSALVHKSLVVRQEDGGETLYRLLETLRIYAVGQLEAKGERRMMAERHLRYFQDLFVRDEDAWETRPDAELRRLYSPHIDNLRAALDAALADPELVPGGISLLGASGRLWSMLVLIPEGQGYFDRFLGLTDKTTPPTDVARLLRYAGILCRHTDRLRTVTLLTKSAAIYRKQKDRLNLGAVLAVLGGEYVYLGRHDDAKAKLDEAWKILSSSNRTKSLWNILNDGGNLAMMRNDIVEARRCLSVAIEFADRIKDTLRRNITTFNLGELEFRCGSIDEAIECASEAASGLRAAGEQFQLSRPLTNLSTYLTLRGDHAEARRYAEEALPLLVKERGHWLRLNLQVWAALAALAGLYAPAAQLIGWVSAEYVRTGEIREPTELALHEKLRALLTANVRPEDIETWTARGGRWDEDFAVDFTLRRIMSAEPSQR
jgi:predicted ATPase/DNA-binding winged helix-turn-helix (wHTH) protein